MTASTENVEKVVNPPKKPVIINIRHSGDKPGYWVKKANAIPIKYPPAKLAERVPIGKFGNNELSQLASYNLGHCFLAMNKKQNALNAFFEAQRI